MRLWYWTLQTLEHVVIHRHERREIQIPRRDIQALHEIARYRDLARVVFYGKVSEEKVLLFGRVSVGLSQEEVRCDDRLKSVGSAHRAAGVDEDWDLRGCGIVRRLWVKF